MLYLVWRIWWYYRKLFSEPPFFFQNGCHYAKMPTLCDWDENWYLRGTLMWRTWWKYWNLFPSRHFCSKLPPYCEISTLSDFNENLDHGVIWCGEHEGVIEIVFRATIFFCQPQSVLMMAYFNALVARWGIQAHGSLYLRFVAGRDLILYT